MPWKSITQKSFFWKDKYQNLMSLKIVHSIRKIMHSKLNLSRKRLRITMYVHMENPVSHFFGENFTATRSLFLCGSALVAHSYGHSWRPPCPENANNARPEQPMVVQGCYITPRLPSYPQFSLCVLLVGVYIPMILLVRIDYMQHVEEVIMGVCIDTPRDASYPTDLYNIRNMGLNQDDLDFQHN